jgi:hypothetical protein
LTGGAVTLGRFQPGGNGGRDVRIFGTKAIFASTFNGLYLVDISDRSRPRGRQRISTDAYPNNITIGGGIAYVSAGSRVLVFRLPES